MSSQAKRVLGFGNGEPVAFPTDRRPYGDGGCAAQCLTGVGEAPAV